jgi:hypothetical protein
VIHHVIHFAYESVEKVAESTPGPDAETGQGFVWVGAGIGALGFGSQMSDAIGTVATEDQLLDVAIAGAFGAFCGACVGLALWISILFVSAKLNPSDRG